MRYFRFTYIWFLTIFILGCCNWVYPQSQVQKNFTYLSPQPSSKYITTQQNVVFRFSNADLQYELNKVRVFIKGSISGELEGNLKLLSDHKTFIFSAQNPFVPNETINVTIISSEYINFHTQLSWECKNGHQTRASFSTVKNRKHWCFKCKMLYLWYVKL